MTDWDHIRQHRTSKERPAGWPDGVYAISMEGLGLLGIHEQKDSLYWDGKEIVTRRVISLRWFELVLATSVAVSTVGIFVLGLGKVVGWWS